MPDQALRILLGDTHPESRAVLEAICQEQGWRLSAVASSAQVLQILRDEPGISLVMIDPTLPGPDRNVAEAIKTSAQFASIPVMFVLHEDVRAPDGVQVDRSIEIDHAGPARVLAAMREALSGAAGERPADARRLEEHQRVSTTPAVPTAAAAAPAPLAPLPGAPRARILVADTVATTRAVLDPLCERHGWELVAIESGFQVLRVVRDTDIDLVLINPHVQAAGVSGIDIARTIKAAAQFRKVPVLFLLHQGNAVPAGVKVDGAVDVDAWPAARLESALSAALGRTVPAVDTAARGVTPAPAPSAAPVPVETPGRPATEPLAQLREDLLEAVQHTVETAVKALARTEDRDTTARLERLEQAVAAMKGAIEDARQGAEDARGSAAPRLEPATAREAMEAVARQHLAGEGRTAVEQIVSALTQEIVPTLAERLVQRQLEQLPSPAARLDELLEHIQEQILQEARSQVERSVATLTREVVPPLVERVVQQQLERLPNPAAKVDELLPQIQEQVLRETRRVADAVTRQQVDVIGATIRQSLATYIDDAVRAVAREIVPTVAERLINSEIARLRKHHQLD